MNKLAKLMPLTKENVKEVENLIKLHCIKQTSEKNGILIINNLDWTDDDIEGDISMLKNMGCVGKYKYKDNYHGIMTITAESKEAKQNISKWLRKNYWGCKDFDEYFCDMYPHLKKYI